jgi:hypothetical protein
MYYYDYYYYYAYTYMDFSYSSWAHSECSCDVFWRIKFSRRSVQWDPLKSGDSADALNAEGEVAHDRENWR